MSSDSGEGIDIQVDNQSVGTTEATSSFSLNTLNFSDGQRGIRDCQQVYSQNSSCGYEWVSNWVWVSDYVWVSDWQCDETDSDGNCTDYVDNGYWEDDGGWVDDGDSR